MREQVIDEQPMQTLHVYVVSEDQLPPPRDYFAMCMIVFSFIAIAGIIAISIFTASPAQEVAFSVNIQGFALLPRSKTIHVHVTATGKQYVPATTATGMITFYNGAIYPQIIPVNTILTGADGISVITDEQATIPAAQQTIPPTYGQKTIPAHSVTPGALGNMRAGDINEACCATSIIAQSTSFHGGRNAYTYTYLSASDVQHATAPLLPMLQSETLSFLSHPQVNPVCATVTTSSPGIGKETTSAVLRITETCKAFSYSFHSVKDAIGLSSRRFGTGTLAHVQFAIVGMKGRSMTLFVTATWEPMIMRHFSLAK